MRKTTLLKEMLERSELIIAPGVYDGISALLANQAGFAVVYASGGAISRSMGYPDLGLITLTEMSAAIKIIVLQSQLPVIADADTGFGNVLNVRRTVQEYEQIGVAALHIEDQTFPKRCGHLQDKSIIPSEEMCEKIQAAVQSRQDPDLLIIARTDAIAVEGIEGAIKRSQAYVKAGADIIFVEAPENKQQIEMIAQRIQAPKLINLFQGGKTPFVSVDELKRLGYKIVIIPSDMQRAAIKSMQNVLNCIKQEGHSLAMTEQMVSFKEREEIVKTAQYLI